MTLTHCQTTGACATSPFENSLARLFQAFEASLGTDSPYPFNAQWLPPVDLYENNDLVTVRAEIPGVKKDDINISLENGYLVLAGERKDARRRGPHRAFPRPLPARRPPPLQSGRQRHQSRLHRRRPDRRTPQSRGGQTKTNQNQG